MAIAPASFDIPYPCEGKKLYLIGVGCCCFIHSKGNARSHTTDKAIRFPHLFYFDNLPGGDRGEKTKIHNENCRYYFTDFCHLEFHCGHSGCRWRGVGIRGGKNVSGFIVGRNWWCFVLLWKQEEEAVKHGKRKLRCSSVPIRYRVVFFYVGIRWRIDRKSLNTQRDCGRNGTYEPGHWSTAIFNERRK